MRRRMSPQVHPPALLALEDGYVQEGTVLSR